MSNRLPSLRHLRFLAAALIVATGGGASVGRTQQVTGSIGASLTILEPVAAPPLRVSGIEVSRDGVARIDVTLPASAHPSQLVMARVTSSTTGFTTERQPPRLVAPSSSMTPARYEVIIARDRRSVAARPTELRVEYLIVAAGT